MFRKSRKNLAESAEELVAHLKVTENIERLQEGQRILTDEIRALSDRITELNSKIDSQQDKVLLESMKQAQVLIASSNLALEMRVRDVESGVTILSTRKVKAKIIDNTD